MLTLLMILHAVLYRPSIYTPECYVAKWQKFYGHITQYFILHNYCYFLYSSMYNDTAYHKNCIVAVILSHTHLSVCSVMLTLRASPKATHPLSPILFLKRLCLNNMKILILFSKTQLPYIPNYFKNVSWNTNCYGYNYYY